MRILKGQSPLKTRGMALIMVMIAIIVLGVLAGGFAYSMKVEMRLAQNHVDDTEMEWLGRSGVELARYVVGQQLNVRTQPFDSLNEKWAGGTGVTNELLSDITLENNPLGNGSFSIKITDNESKININAADQALLQQALTVMGVDATSASTITDSILDWRDQDSDPHLSGAESDYYLSLDPPYYAKDGWFDDVSELLLVKGMEPGIYYGASSSNYMQNSYSTPRVGRAMTINQMLDQQTISKGMKDLFTAVSSGYININTASREVLMLLPGMDPNVAQQIITMRSGPDGVEGNEDDMPFPNIQVIQGVSGMNAAMFQMISRYLAVRSMTFEVDVDAVIGSYHRHFVALLRRNSPRDVQILYFHWR